MTACWPASLLVWRAFPSSEWLGRLLSSCGEKSRAGSASLAYSAGVIEFWLKLWQLTRPYKVRFILGMIFGALSGIADTLVLVTVAFVVGAVFSGPPDSTVHDALSQLPEWAKAGFSKAQDLVAASVQGSHAGLLIVVSLIPLAVLYRGVCNYLNSYLMGWVASRAISDLRVRVFDHLLNLPMSFLSRNSTGELMSRIGDIGLLQNMIGASLVTLIRDPINVISLAYYVFKMAPRLTFGSDGDASAVRHPNRHIQQESPQIRGGNPNRVCAS